MRRLVCPAAIGRLLLMATMVFGLVFLAPGGSDAAAPSPQAPPPFEEGILLAGFQEGLPDAAVAAIERQEGATRVRIIGAGTHVLQVGRGEVAAKIAALQRHTEVRYAEPNYLLYATDAPNDSSYGQLWAMKNTGQGVAGVIGTPGADTRVEAAWALTTGNSSVVVGVVDTGVDYTHSDLAANVWSNPGGIGGCAAGTHGFNAITGTCDPMDDHDHGSHVSGTIGAVGNNSLGVAGVNWTTSIMGLKFLSARGSGTTADAIEAIHFAVQAKIAGINVRVLNNSWGGGGFSQALLDEINLAGANDILFVVAAGNSSANLELTPSYPCSYNSSAIICVAATDQADNLAGFSNYGSTSADLGAPGTNILSTVRGGGYAYYQGTSMATPHVSGAAALILSGSWTTTPTVSVLRAAILNNVDQLPSLAGKTATGGRLNVCGAVPGCRTNIDPTVPGTPVLSGSAGNAIVHLTWTAPSNGGSAITNYRVYRGAASGGETLLATLGSVTSYDDSAVTNGSTYYYQVTAVNSLGEGARSNEAAATPQAAAVPTAPQSLTAKPANGKGISLSWQAPASSGSSPITGYRVYRSTSTNTETFLVAVGNVKTYKDTSTKRGVTYYYKVAAVNAAGESPLSSEAGATAR